MLCQNCNQNVATYHSVKNINGQISETYLCSACRRVLHDAMGLNGLAQNLGVFGSLSSFAEFLNGISSSPDMQQIKSIACSSCGTTLSELGKSLYVGCQHCYQAFSDSLLPMLNSIQHGSTHTGKIPKGRESMSQYKQIEQDIRKALLEERYEDAIVLREKLKQVKTDA
jgi:protein arginine kinase activator